MMKQLLFSILSVSWVAFASSQLDDQYSYKGFVVGIVNAKTQPVFADQVESELIALLQANPRFDFLEKNQELFKQGLKSVANTSINPVSTEKLKIYDGVFKDQYVKGTRSVILAEIIKEESDYQINLSLVITATGELIASETVSVGNPKSLDSFVAATREGLGELTKKIPFDASILKRDGYLVVLDRGARVFRPGTQVSVFTMENKNGKVLLEETGLIGITQVEENLTFGKVMVEKRPYEVARGNKLQFSDSPPMEVASLLDAAEGREPASLWGNEFEVSKGKLGVVNLDLGPSLLTLSNKTGAGAEAKVNKVLPGGSLNGEIWLTSKYYINVGLNYGAASLVNSNQAGSKSVGMTVSAFKLLVGYRLNIFAPSSGPIVYFRGGYGTQSFAIPDNGSTVIFKSTAYSGPMISGGVSFPVNDKLGLGLDITSLIFPSVSETPLQTVASSNISAWTFVLKTTYNYRRDIDFVGKLFFQRFGSESPAQTTRALSSLNTSSQSTKGLMFGVSYYY